MKEIRPKKLKKRKKFNPIGVGKEKDFIVENLSMMLGSGIGIAAALDVVSAGVKSGQLKKIIKYMKEETDSGTPLWRCFEDSGLLPDNMIFLIKVGESSGRLPENLKIVALQEQKERSFKSKVISAMIYPIIVFSLTIFIGLGVAFFVLPKLSSVFDNMNVELPTITKILINSGTFLEKNIQIVLASTLGIFGILFLMSLIPATKIFLKNVLIHIPRIGSLMKEIEISRFGYILGTLMNAGLPIVDSVNSLVESTQSSMYKKLYLKIKNSIEEGDSFEKALAKIKNSKKLIPMQIQQMVFAGERSGKLSEVLTKIDEIYEEKVDVSTKNLATVLEPILLVVVWFGVLFIALAVIMPIYGLIGGLDQAG